jgi:Protein of unknown function (DUF559)
MGGPGQDLMRSSRPGRRGGLASLPPEGEGATDEGVSGMKTDEGVPPSQGARARAMRGGPTAAALRLWRLLRDRRLCGLKFRRRVPVGPYIVDFLIGPLAYSFDATCIRYRHNREHLDMGIVRQEYRGPLL